MKVRELIELLQSVKTEKEIKMDAELDHYLRIDDIIYNDHEDCYVLRF